VVSDERREGREKQILHYAPFGYAQGRQDDTDWNGTDGEAGSDSRGGASWVGAKRQLSRRTCRSIARDWRGGKVFCGEWSKWGVERTLGALNG